MVENQDGRDFPKDEIESPRLKMKSLLEDIITREQVAVMIANYQTFSGRVPSDVSTERDFADNGEISSWARTAVTKLAMQGIMNGKPGNLFDPKGNATRAEFAAILHMFSERVTLTY